MFILSIASHIKLLQIRYQNSLGTLMTMIGQWGEDIVYQLGSFTVPWESCDTLNAQCSLSSETTVDKSNKLSLSIRVRA